MSGPNSQDTAKAAVQRFLSDDSQWAMSLSGTGAVFRLERKFVSLVGLPHTLAVSNATLGLWALFLALDIRDSEVISTPYTWGGTLSGLIQAGNRPVFADIDRKTLTLDPAEVRKLITTKTKAILAVDIYGYPSVGPELRDIADEYGLALIQDSAQSFGAYIGEHHTGWWADAAVFSFTWGKALFAGEGGMIVARDPELINRLVWQTQHPSRQLRDVPNLPTNELALNLRINPLTAVWAEATFAYALAGVANQRRRSMRILELLKKKGVSKTEIPKRNRVRPSFHVLTFEPCMDAQEINQLLRDNGWELSVCLPPITDPIYCHEAYRNISRLRCWPKPNRCPMAEEQCHKRVRLAAGKISEENPRHE